MKLFLSYTSDRKHLPLKKIKYELESFAYFKSWQIPYLKVWDDFILDSGAFTFLQSHKDRHVSFDNYLQRYIDFIIANRVKHFFELDIDRIVGYRKVKEMRAKLEQQTGLACIPVWHKSRGIPEWKNLTSQYQCVAIGGFAIKEIKKKEYDVINPLIEIAHKNGCKVHGLGFTQSCRLENYDFDSVDSTSWKSGGRFGQIHNFDGRAIIQTKLPKGNDIHWSKIDTHNLLEWIKYQKYMENVKPQNGQLILEGFY